MYGNLDYLFMLPQGYTYSYMYGYDYEKEEGRHRRQEQTKQRWAKNISMQISRYKIDSRFSFVDRLPISYRVPCHEFGARQVVSWDRLG